MNILLLTSPAPAVAPLYTTEKRPPLGLGILISILRGGGGTMYYLRIYTSGINLYLKMKNIYWKTGFNVSVYI
jgi:hypothetical protein